jgi:hypothetical protein
MTTQGSSGSHLFAVRENYKVETRQFLTVNIRKDYLVESNEVIKLHLLHGN